MKHRWEIAAPPAPGPGRPKAVAYDRHSAGELDLARTLLPAMIVNRLLVRKGVVASGDIARVAKKLDRMDGTADGKLEPATGGPKEKRKRPMVRDPGASL